MLSLSPKLELKKAKNTLTPQKAKYFQVQIKSQTRCQAGTNQTYIWKPVREGYLEEPKEMYLHLLVFMLPLRYEFEDGVL